ncbi:AbrB family transcriptional regulator [Anaerobacillus sp. MEB173]|uniref:AbrB family transcriptional regulator n=1 Tax=Anaerobacillus sp. MEB173 TaxID=3383345 RepID=UPI003F8F1D1A
MKELVQKVAYLILAVLVGYIFVLLSVPAGWLLGSLLTGIFCSLFIKKLIFPDIIFKFVLGIVGTNIGFMMQPTIFSEMKSFIFPLIITIFITILYALLLGIYLRQNSFLDANTAFFCCLPGGASEAIAISKDYGADQRIVAAFHTGRITFFVLTIPFIVGIFNRGNIEIITEQNEIALTPSKLAIFLLILCSAVFISKNIKIPGGILLVSMLLGFLVGTLLIGVNGMPRYVTGIGQALIGALIGMRFDRESLEQLKSLGPISIKIIVVYLIMSIAVSILFYILTPASFFISLLGTVPAGAPEMSSTATALNLAPALVASLQIMRVMTILLILPLLLKWVTRFGNIDKGETVEK